MPARLIQKENDVLKVLLYSSNDVEHNVLPIEHIRNLCDRNIKLRLPIVEPRNSDDYFYLYIGAQIVGTQLVTGSGKIVKVYAILEPEGYSEDRFKELLADPSMALEVRGYPDPDHHTTVVIIPHKLDSLQSLIKDKP